MTLKLICVKLQRINKIIAKLKNAQLIKTKEGSINGGYCFTLNPKEVTLLSIFNAVEQSLVKTSCKTGNQDMECLIASGMAGVMDNIAANMDDRCRTILVQLQLKILISKFFKISQTNINNNHLKNSIFF